jgi:hypothetical protein
MDSVTVEKIIVVASLVAVVVPVVLYVWVLIREAFPRVILVLNEKGEEIGTISAESVLQTDNNDLARLHERIRRSKHVSFEAAA